MARPRLLALGAIVVLIAAAGAWFALRDRGLPAADPPAALDAEAPDPFAYTDARREEFERRATAGFAHVVYAKSPGGVVATGARVAAYRPQIEQVAADSGVPAETLEAIVFLESAGRPSAAADPKLEGAVGLTQILAETGQNLLGMRVDPAAARKLTRRIDRAERRGQTGRADRLRARRRKVDQRFDPGASLRATARYLNLAKGQLRGRDDYAVAGYHMGIGNLQSVLRDYGEDPGSYTALYFGSTPASQAGGLPAPGRPRRRLLHLPVAGQGVRVDHAPLPPGPRRRWSARTSSSGPRTRPRRCCTPRATPSPSGPRTTSRPPIATARCARSPNAPVRLGLRRDRQMGELARKLEQPRRLYRGLRPEAYALAAYLARMTRQAGGGRSPLTVTSTVRDREYQRVLIGRNREATQNYSLHTTGLLLRRAAPLQRRPPGPGVPVHADPPPGAEPDRLGPRAGGDPPDGVQRCTAACAVAGGGLRSSPRGRTS